MKTIKKSCFKNFVLDYVSIKGISKGEKYGWKFFFPSLTYNIDICHGIHSSLNGKYYSCNLGAHEIHFISP